MIRLDMSEFQTPESMDRLMGTKDEHSKDLALVNQIRNQPFSVLLLDEFEKAYLNIWDMFLQVFDDGRLTDRRGQTADFRHCIIILTSNLGANIPSGASIGFSGNGQAFTPGSVERAVNNVFRKEFINRVDRVIIFRPLDRSVMREILYKELNAVLERRGLRSRSWAVEWDDSAIDFLLNKGFTNDLGARPLKRAVERYLLSPLAMTIVNHQFPEGDQFLFVRCKDDKINVEFIDPDAPMEELAEDGSQTIPTATGQLRIQGIVSNPHGTVAELDFISQQYERLRASVDGEEWQQKKQKALSQMSSPGFWDSQERFAILGLAEYMDRIEEGLRTAASLLNRLAGVQQETRKRVSKKVLQRLAQQIYLVDLASCDLAEGRQHDAFLLVEASRESVGDTRLTNEFAIRIGSMYRQWASLRKMRIEVLEETGREGNTPYRLLLAVMGFAAYAILEPEAGLHVYEKPRSSDKKKGLERHTVRVRVAPQPEEPAGPSPEAFRAQAIAVFSELVDGQVEIVRRYREEPAPLVRDSVREWRTGNFADVLRGNFDVVC
jgi:ATP-dependent Clp protease ATP-binding subunit ClpC